MLKTVADFITNTKVVAAFLFALIAAIIVGTVFIYSYWLQGQQKLAEFETLKKDVAVLQTKDYLDTSKLEERFKLERQTLLASSVQVAETEVTGGAQGWNAPVTCPQGQYAAGVQIEGANSGVKYCITCFVRAKVLCRPFVSP
jgi:hypothetical protein